jgi:amino acid adenylation domain-containing protein/thioester reductase-like protein
MRGLGVGPEVLVGICVERSVEMVVGLLGILKAGAAYVPLDPAFPKERITFMLQDARVPLVLTQESLEAGLSGQGARLVRLDEDAEAIKQHSAENPTSGARADDLAYVIYTSGSTGRPKGVQITHGSVVNFLASMGWEPGLTEQDTLLAVTTLSFDIAGLEIFLPLTVGARLLLVPREVTQDGQRLTQTLATSAATVMQATPATWQMLLETGWSGSPNLKILCGGEALPAGLAQQLLGRCASLWNVYGPTETTIWSTVHRVDGRGGPVPIGRPIANTQVYVTDRRCQPVPVGVAGELLIGGAGLARDCLGRPELTAEKFMPNPFSDSAGSRLYRTGDLARWLPSGELECLGRLDHQVKVRGFRIEPGEVEAALRQHPAVRQAVVVAREIRRGDKRLIAYVVADEHLEPSSSELHRFLREQLPEYMVPSLFMTLEALPLSPNGKVDRQALPAPERARPESEETYVAPQGPVEEAVAAVWAEVLGLEQVGAHDNFFELGGHSLLATQVISRLRKTLQVELPLRALFEAPTLAALGERIEEVRRASLGLPTAPLRPIPRDGELPLAFGQETFLFLEQLQPGSPVFNMDVAARLRGPLNLTALEHAVNEVVRRHEILRTTFVAREGRPSAIIAPPTHLPLQVLDLTDLLESQREDQARRLADEESRRPFDLERGPLFRASRLRLGLEDHVGLLTAHHAVFDGWSMGIFLREVGLLYEAFAAGQPSPLPELPVRYADFAHWQRQWLQSGLMEDQLAYWKQQLAGPLPVLELPTDHPRPAVRTFHGARQLLVVPPALTQATHALARREGCTLYMVLLAAFQTLLHRYSGQGDLCIGSPIAGRNRAEIEGLIGFFVNTLVLRTDLSGDPAFAQLLARVREVCLGAYAHQDLPFEMLVQELRPQRELSRSSLFQVLFILQNAPLKIPTITGLTSSPLVELSDNGTSKFDLILTLTESTEGLLATIEYNTDLYQQDTIERLLGHYRTLLEAVVAEPGLTLSRMPLLTTAEQEQLAAWNQNDASYPADECIHELFEVQAARTPDAVAVVDGDRRLSYRELNRWANRLANRLRELGVGPDVLVGLYLERSLDLMAGLLGVLKAGGAYVPLDPAYPGQRLAAIVEDAEPRVLLTQRALVDDLPPNAAHIICLDTTESELGSEANPGRAAASDNLAYMIYTSGTTGKPKGVMVTHGGLCNAYRAWEDAYRLRSEATTHLQMASCAFDVFTEDWTRALCSGGKLVLCPREVLLEPARLYDLMRRERVDFAEFVPSALRSLAQHLEESGQSLDFMRLLIAGSDVWYAGEYQKIRRLCGPQTRLINSYGLTEATIDSTYFESAELNLCEERPVPIGRPFANTRIHVLDRNLQPVPIGVLGELHVGGSGLARGYSKDSELTAKKFIPDPFSSCPGDRLFRTGDLARYLPDGCVELLGRTDHQVKVRGFRIDPGEIESVLCQHPGVRQAAVVAHGDTPDSKRLVAYLTRPAPEPQDLRGFLREKLPEYMVPSSFVMLNALPLSPNGKVDRKALPAPERPRAELSPSFELPRSDVEKTLAGIWAEVLQLDQVGIRDNFFDLGGHSLALVRVMSRVRVALKVEVHLRHLFENPTIVELAGLIEDLSRTGTVPAAEAVPGASLVEEVILDPEITPAEAVLPSLREPERIFLTGATGYLGTFLLHDLLRQTRAEIFCLIRSVTVEEGKSRLRKSLETYGLWDESLGERIMVVPGDLSRPLLGLSQEQFDQLTVRTDVIFHNGALVNMMSPYEALKAANVFGTREVLRLACQSKTKPVHYISTVSVFDVANRNDSAAILEQDSLDHGGRRVGGYAQSKWVAEKLVVMARDRGLPVAIYRPGRIIGAAASGAWNTDDLMCGLIKACVELGLAPDLDMPVEMVPVDYVSGAAVRLSLRPESLGQSFHLVNPAVGSLSELLDGLRIFGYPLRKVSYPEWFGETVRRGEPWRGGILRAFLPAHAAPELKAPARQGGPTFDCRNTQAGLAATPIACPDLDADLVGRYLTGFVRRGFLPAPPESKETTRMGYPSPEGGH